MKKTFEIPITTKFLLFTQFMKHFLWILNTLSGNATNLIAVNKL